MKLASVILDIPTQALDAPYTYAVPEEAGDQPIEVGCAVLVPFGPRQAVGFVIGIEERAEGDWPAGLDPAKLKGIVRAVSRPYFDEEGAACAQWLSERYIAPLSSCVRLFTPPGGVPRMVRAQGGYWRLEEPTVGEVDDRWVVPGPALADFEPRKNAVKQASIAAALERGELRVAELTAEFGAVSSPLKALKKQGVVRIEHRRRMRGFQVPSACRPTERADAAASRNARYTAVDEGSRTEVRHVSVIDPGSSAAETLADSLRQPAAVQPASLQPAGAVQPAGSFTPSPKPPLTRGQADALAAIDAARSRGAGEVVLVDGVTGSGKTEVYLQAIEETLAAGRTACVLVPEISLTPQTVARFRGRFGDLVAVMHSRMSQGERYDQWDFIRSGAARVVVGARSALFTPLSNLGLIVIDEEHEGSYKQDSAPRYHARDVAVWMARRAGAAVVLGSATPSIEALHACAKNPSWHQVSLPERANGKPLPEVQVVDMAKEFSGGSRSMFALPLARALEEELAAGRKAVLLLNQRGFAKFLLCRECGFVPECPSCSTSLTYHERGNFLICHHCGYRIPTPPVCPECGSPYLKKFGAGTQRVEAELRVLLDEMPGVGPGVPIVRMDADTTSGKGAHQRLLEEFAAADAAVLLGTQMIAKGLDFEDVTLVGVINADTMLKLPDYRASERTFDLVEQVAGRAGRAELPGRVLVQTYEADAPAIRAAAAYDRALFLRDELPKRRLLGYPPYVRMANVLVWSKDEPAVRRVAAELQAALEEAVRDFGGDGWSVLPATPCVLAKLRGTYRWHIVVKCPADADLSDALLPLFRRRKPDRDANVAVDVDPDDLL
ncbi:MULTISPECIES: primosomal protein N' [unclassified Eggerthella]|uniref:replication restart helicase PriA n=1 Tax=unclassified Eggerthella TaxID=2648737 RepID=UPI0013694145|nr:MULTISPECIES: primosomal protein N' [unclassified Eggerthella]MZJ93533.1 primosomal protein N' [Eggerthella sp. BIOML-A3]MZJ99047.1 primosomal protein N' [Eggerthella sp. BIOML-A1]MZK35843.1 primosomal protein N' [Eggerthella sp. BIOML-A5]